MATNVLAGKPISIAVTRGLTLVARAILAVVYISGVGFIRVPAIHECGP
jgi:hypothetical protein